MCFEEEDVLNNSYLKSKLDVDVLGYVALFKKIVFVMWNN